MSDRKQTPEEEALSEDEIAAQEGEELPDREVMSVISLPTDDTPLYPGHGGPIPLGPPPSSD